VLVGSPTGPAEILIRDETSSRSECDTAAGGTHSISGKSLAVIGGASAASVAGILVAESNKKKKCVSSANDKKCKCKKDKNGNEDCEE
jgi:hypothetical protein